MSSIAIILLLTLFQFISGWGVLNLLRINLKPGATFALSVLLGVAGFSLVPFILQLLYIPLTALSIFLSLAAAALLLNLRVRKSFLRLRMAVKATEG